MKTKIYMILGALFVTLLATAQQKAWTLEQCVDTALANNRNVKQKILTRKSNEIAYQQAKNDLLPNLNASAGQYYNFGRSLGVDNVYKNTNSSQTSVGISTNITLFDGLKMKYNIDARMADLKASEADLKKMQSDLVMSVSTAFLQVLLNKELLQIAKDQHDLTLSKIEQRKSLVSAGKLAEGEVYELIAQESKEEMNRIKAEQSLNYSLLDLAQILELEDFEKFDVVVPTDLLNAELQLLNPQTVYDGALIHRPEIKVAEFRLQGNETNIQIAKSGYYPTLSLGAQTGTRYYNMSGFTNDGFGKQFSNNLSSSIGLNLSIPIFNKFEVKNGVRNAQIRLESSKLDVENTKIELRKTIQQAYQNALAAKARWGASQKSEVASREAYRFANQKYENGRATVYELYQAKSNLTQVLSEQTQAKYEYVFRIKILEWLK
jgi:outer membrane protein